jgi:hypothetical protein
MGFSPVQSFDLMELIGISNHPESMRKRAIRHYPGQHAGVAVKCSSAPVFYVTHTRKLLKNIDHFRDQALKKNS